MVNVVVVVQSNMTPMLSEHHHIQGDTAYRINIIFGSSDVKHTRIYLLRRVSYSPTQLEGQTLDAPWARIEGYCEGIHVASDL